MSPGDTIRLCKHPAFVPHPLPPRLPLIPSGANNRLVWRDPHTSSAGTWPDRQWPELMRCVTCGQPGEVCPR